MLRRWRYKSFEEEYALHVYKPMLVLNPEKKNFYDFTIDDFTMENYKPMKPQLKLELGI